MSTHPVNLPSRTAPERMSSHRALAVDIGATKVAIALVDENYRVTNKQEIPTNGNHRLWQDMEDLSRDLMNLANGSLIGVGIGSAGPLHLQLGAVSPVNIPAWRNFPIVERFKNLAKLETVILHGDAMALAHAEYRLGAGRGCANMLGIVVSTGVGGGLILNGQLFTGESGNASYIGHHTIDFDGALCACGRRGCVETYSSGPRMVAIARARGWKGDARDSFVDLADSARQGDSAAIETIDDGARALAIGIVNALGILDIRTVVIGGGVSQAGSIYWDPLLAHFAKEARSTSFIEGCDLRLAQLDRDAGVIGAALGVLDLDIA